MSLNDIHDILTMTMSNFPISINNTNDCLTSLAELALVEQSVFGYSTIKNFQMCCKDCSECNFYLCAGGNIPDDVENDLNWFESQCIYLLSYCEDLQIPCFERKVLSLFGNNTNVLVCNMNDHDNSNYDIYFLM